MPRLFLTILGGFAVSAAAEPRAPEAAHGEALEAALAQDDQCALGDEACALNALQLRGSALGTVGESAASDEQLAEEATGQTQKDTAEMSSRRRRHGQNNDLSVTAARALLKDVNVTRTRIVEVVKELVKIEEGLNETRAIVNSMGAESLEQTAVERPHHKVTKGAPPREKYVQGKMKACQEELDIIWHKLSEDGRMIEWMKNKMRNPDSVGDFEPTPQKGSEDDEDEDDEDEDKDDDEKLLLPQADATGEKPHHKNPSEEHMKSQIEEMNKEIKDIKEQLVILQNNSKNVRILAEKKAGKVSYDASAGSDFPGAGFRRDKEDDDDEDDDKESAKGQEVSKDTNKAKGKTSKGR